MNQDTHVLVSWLLFCEHERHTEPLYVTTRVVVNNGPLPLTDNATRPQTQPS